MSENLSETDTHKLFYSSEETEEPGDTETTDSSEDDTTSAEEEGAESDNDESTEEEQSETFEFDGQEISAETLGEWQLAFKNRKHQQADYSKKGQAASEKMKLATAEFDKFQDLNSSLQESVTAMESMLNEEENLIDWDELTDDDPGQALKLERKFKKRRKELDGAKTKIKAAKKQAEQSKINEQSNELVRLVPEWFNANGSTNKTYKQDSDSILEYLQANSYPANYANQITTAREWQVLRDASKYQSLQKKKAGIKKKVTSVKSVKEKSRSSSTELSNAEVNKLFYGS